MSGDGEAPRYERREPASLTASKAKRRNRAKHTEPELLLRRRLWALGLRYRLHGADLPGKPDLLFRRQRVVVFVDGDFWHGRNWPQRRERLKHGHNGDYWQAKIEYNMARDQRNQVLLEQAGWRVIRLWETDIRERLDEAVRAIIYALGSEDAR